MFLSEMFCRLFTISLDVSSPVGSKARIGGVHSSKRLFFFFATKWANNGCFLFLVFCFLFFFVCWGVDCWQLFFRVLHPSQKSILPTGLDLINQINPSNPQSSNLSPLTHTCIHIQYFRLLLYTCCYFHTVGSHKVRSLRMWCIHSKFVDEWFKVRERVKKGFIIVSK